MGDGNFDFLRRARLRPAGRRGKLATGKPSFELGTISINRSKLVMLMAVDGQLVTNPSDATGERAVGDTVQVLP